MRTTVDIDDDLLSEAKQIAAAQGTSVRALLEQGLRNVLRDSKQKPKRHQKIPRSHRRGGLRPGVQLDDSAALLDIMEGRDGAS